VAIAVSPTEKPVRQIIYFSTASDRQDSIVIAGILAQSRQHNLRDAITGLLVGGGHRYLQVIEGPDVAIRRLTARLRRDDRHLGMTILVDRHVDRPSFSGWSMAFTNEPQLGEYANFSDLVAKMRAGLTDAKLREQLDCFGQTFASDSARIPQPLWQIAKRY
jgi:hypothetical protein